MENREPNPYNAPLDFSYRNSQGARTTQPYQDPRFRDMDLNLEKAKDQSDYNLSLRPLRDSLNHLYKSPSLEKNHQAFRLNQSAIQVNREIEQWTSYLSRNSELKGPERQAAENQLKQRVYELKKLHEQLISEANYAPRTPGSGSVLNSMKARLGQGSSLGLSGSSSSKPPTGFKAPSASSFGSRSSGWK